MALDYEKDGRIAVLTLNRPQAHNALDRESLELLAQAWSDFAADPEAAALIVTGAGRASFCVGGDLKEWLAQDRDPHAAGIMDKLRPPMRQTRMFKPVIAAVNGHCLGGGLELALACDLRLASRTARFGLPEIKRGIFPGQGATQRLARVLPYNLAAEMLFMGEIIGADEALRMGLVNRVVDQENLLPLARSWALKLARRPPLALAAAKEALLAGYDLPLKEGLALEGRLRKEIGRTQDAREGMTAFLEKRKPLFKGE